MKEQNVTTLSVIEDVLVNGNLDNLTATERVNYYKSLCDTLKLNPLTKPFEYIRLNGKLTIYAKKDCTDQLRKCNSVSIYKMESKAENDVYIVTAYARDKFGREDVSSGAVSIAGLKGEALANAIMKAETKSKRRVTLSIGGLGILDETEIESIKLVEPQNIEEVIDLVSLEDSIFKQISSIETQEDLESYTNWKKANKRGIQNLLLEKPELSNKYQELLAKQMQDKGISKTAQLLSNLQGSTNINSEVSYGTRSH